jgi:hypothetical protein
LLTAESVENPSLVSIVGAFFLQPLRLQQISPRRVDLSHPFCWKKPYHVYGRAVALRDESIDKFCVRQQLVLVGTEEATTGDQWRRLRRHQTVSSLFNKTQLQKK